MGPTLLRSFEIRKRLEKNLKYCHLGDHVNSKLSFNCMIFKDTNFSIKWAEKGQWMKSKVKKLLIEQFCALASKIVLGCVFLASYKLHRLGLCVQPTVLWDYLANWTLLLQQWFKNKDPHHKCITKEEVLGITNLFTNWFFLTKNIQEEIRGIWFNFRTVIGSAFQQPYIGLKYTWSLYLVSMDYRAKKSVVPIFLL